MISSEISQNDSLLIRDSSVLVVSSEVGHNSEVLICVGQEHDSILITNKDRGSNFKLYLRPGVILSQAMRSEYSSSLSSHPQPK